MNLAKAGKILLAEDQGALVKMLMQWAQDDDPLEDRILHFAAGRLAPESAVAAGDRAFPIRPRIVSGQRSGIVARSLPAMSLANAVAALVSRKVLSSGLPDTGCPGARVARSGHALLPMRVWDGLN